MDVDPILLSRIQLAFTVSFQIIFPSFTIGLAAWLATMEGVQLATAILCSAACGFEAWITSQAAPLTRLAYGVAANALNLLPLSAAPRTLPWCAALPSASA
jgi:hypothetical protein